MNNDTKKFRQNEISQGYLNGSDLGMREKQTLNDACDKTGFIPDKLISRSSWWGSNEIGAFHYAGEFAGKPAVLKVQGVKPAASEADLIKGFSTINKSKLIRAPYIYAAIPWDEKNRYEAIVLEQVQGEKVITAPTDISQINRFFEVYQDYRANCLHSPWVEKPKLSAALLIKANFTKWREISNKLYPNHPLREAGDAVLIDQALSVLEQGYQNIDLEFMHGHFSTEDLYQTADHVVILSNLYWSWRPPLYDAVFGYHWFMYHLGSLEGINPEQIEQQRSLWLSAIESLPQVQANPTLLKLALLERAAAGLNLDVLSADPERPITSYLINRSRNDIKKSLPSHEYSN
jgi:hypothetical protein